MTARRRTANKMFQKPLTTEEIGGLPNTPKPGKAIVCKKCGKFGGTLMKIGDHYEHINCEGVK